MRPEDRKDPTAAFPDGPPPAPGEHRTDPPSRRARIHQILEQPSRTDRLSWAVELGLIALVLANVIGVALETEPALHAEYRWEFFLFDALSVGIFTVEYALRLWVSPEGNPRKPPWRARLRYARTPMALVDLVAILPFYLALVFPLNLQALRVLRLFRVYKLARYSPALAVLMSVIREEAASLAAAFSILAILLVFAATGAYFVERAAQPENFGSIPEAMWWAIVTLTTVGYGDVTPVTAAGRIFGAFVTVLGVGVAALPAGILASGLADHLRRRRDHLRIQFRLALEDGKMDLTEGRAIERLRGELGISHDIARAIYDEVLLKRRRDGEVVCPRCGHRIRRAEPAE
ncbi:ion transporter [Amaricoccus solimangrovi]|uniref:Ion transporter n=1 Tax=Amaricoccus solimangrovi TaxID=2589815 RepID=A0A501WNW2_9RHOB|nr:ion transporter [Amaricoccus solimangrovi]TPE51018.1 ion transporter [Amaricoccus solimangrovi]